MTAIAIILVIIGAVGFSAAYLADVIGEAISKFPIDKR